MVAKRREWGVSSIINHPIPSFPAAKAAGSNAWDVSPEDLGDPFEALGQFFFFKTASHCWDPKKKVVIEL
jgi:hypothetical protein